MKAVLHYRDGHECEVLLREKKLRFSLNTFAAHGVSPLSRIRYTMPRVDYRDVVWVDFCADGATAREGDEGYFVVPQGGNSLDSFLMYFSGHTGAHYESDMNTLTVYGGKFNDRSFLAVVTGMSFNYRLIAEEKAGLYRCFPRISLEGKKPYEPIAVEMIYLSPECDYNSIAAAYRAYLLAYRGCKPIRERENEALAYAKSAPLVRIRMAWKPVPSPVPEQTLENEPPIHIACTFDRFIEIMEECKRQGVERAEFQLVGWNKSGHDGRWPQVFPVEPLLGGEEGFFRALARAKELGYRVSCHTNSTEQFHIAEDFDPENTQIKKNGEPAKGGSWGGGQSYGLCPKKALCFAKKYLPRVATLGLNGVHYIDVISTVQPRACYHPKHRLTERGGQRCWQKIAKFSHKVMGGFSSEGGYDHLAGQNDYALYVSFRDFRREDNLPSGADRIIPFWQLVFHGITLSNPYCETVNPTAKPKQTQLKAAEYGARPSFYFHSRFVVDPSGERSNWMGSEDLSCATDEEMRHGVSCIKAGEDEYRARAPLADCFMIRHEVDATGVVYVTYSNGAKVTIDYNAETETVENPDK